MGLPTPTSPSLENRERLIRRLDIIDMLVKSPRSKLLEMAERRDMDRKMPRGQLIVALYEAMVIEELL